MRQLQVRLVKTPKPETVTPEVPNTTVQHVVSTLAHTVDKTVRTLGLVAIGYVVLDTVRSVVLAKATQPQ